MSYRRNTKKHFNRRKFNSYSKKKSLRQSNFRNRNVYKSRRAEHIYRKLIKNWEREIIKMQGYVHARPLSRYNQVQVKIKPFDIRYLSNKFNKIARDTFRTNLRKKNPSKYISNMFRLYIIFSAIQKNISKKSKGLGIPSKNNLPPYV